MMVASDADQLLGAYYGNFHSTFPVILPVDHLLQRLQKTHHGMDLVLLVIRFIGSLYTNSASSEQYYNIAYEKIWEEEIPASGFSVQALMIFAIAQYHNNIKLEARQTLDMAICIAVKIRMNSKAFAYEKGEGNPVLEESWRRTYFFLHMTDQHLSISMANGFFEMLHVENDVDLPCDDEAYETGVSAVVFWEYRVRVVNISVADIESWDMGRIRSKGAR
jgi:nicotinate-nucleotide pyrophosphorylase (carboxylating)